MSQGGGSHPAAAPGPMRLVCDASLGRLARWLRAAGHEVAWSPAWWGGAALEAALRLGATLVTTEQDLADRRPVRSGEVRLVRVSSRLPCASQLADVVLALGLARCEPRCMTCGGTLAPVAKAAVRDRIPPRTALWRDDYWACSGCGALYWKGTHWARIERGLEAVFGPR